MKNYLINDKQELNALITSGLSRREIAEHYNTSDDVVSRALTRFDLRIPWKNTVEARMRTRAKKNTSASFASKIKETRREALLSKVDITLLTQYFVEEKMTLISLAEHFKVSKSSIERLIKEYGIQRKSKVTESFLKDAFVLKHRTQKEIGRELKVSPSRVGQLTRQHGLRTDWKHYSRKSEGEKSVVSFLQSLNIVLKENDRTVLYPQEIDIFCPEHSIAVEYHGEYWHSDINVRATSTYKKWKALQAKGIQLIVIWESEWKTKRTIWEQKLKAIFNKSTQSIVYARVTEARPISAVVKNSFLIKNHIQGSDQSHSQFGLYYKNELVAVMSFRKSRNNTEIELSRYATSAHIPGGFSKLLKYAAKQERLTEIYSWSDNRLSAGGLYRQTGWQQIKTIPADYQIFYKDRMYHKSYFRKSNLKKLFPELEGTEWEIEDQVRALRCWDCGKTKWKYIINA